jgi:Ser/Thr protein kinase RdoA (MazF antagonist)
MLSDTRARLGSHPHHENLKEARAICGEAQQLMDQIEAQLLRMEGQHLPRHLVHGDFHLGNLLFGEDDRVRYTLDFDFVAHRHRIYDIAYALRLAMPQLTDNPDCTLDSSLVRAWLDLYESRALHPLTDGERAFLGFQLAQVALFFIAEACRARDPVGQVLRESPYLELAMFLVRYPDSLFEGC